MFPGDVLIGDFVFVEADRGEDMGLVADIIEESVFRGMQIQGVPNCQLDGKSILRVAQPHDVRLLASKAQEESHALKYCHQKVVMRKMPMLLLDAEFQYDRNKLTFFYKSTR